MSCYCYNTVTGSLRVLHQPRLRQLENTRGPVLYHKIHRIIKKQFEYTCNEEGSQANAERAVGLLGSWTVSGVFWGLGQSLPYREPMKLIPKNPENGQSNRERRNQGQRDVM